MTKRKTTHHEEKPEEFERAESLPPASLVAETYLEIASEAGEKVLSAIRAREASAVTCPTCGTRVPTT